MSPRPPPNVRVALAHGLGVIFSLSSPAPPLLGCLLLTFAVLIWTWSRPVRTLVLVLSLSLWFGAVSGYAGLSRSHADCRTQLAEGQAVELVGWFEAQPGRGSAPLHVEEGSGCLETLRSFIVRDAPVPRTGRVIAAKGVWRRSRFQSVNPERAGSLRISSWHPVDATSALKSPGSTRFRASLESKINTLFGDQSPMVHAVLLAGRSGLDPELRDRFAASGTIHLLAISGFHVGVVFGILGLLAGRLGLAPRTAVLVSSLGVLLYVAFLGFPAAATRAALLLSGLMAARLRGSPASRLGLLATVFMFLLIVDPLWLADVGFQLSFAGALGLVLWSQPLRRLFRRVRIHAGVAEAVAAGVAATLPTIPLVAFHFGRISLAGIPATVLVSPLFVLAIPWTLVALALDVVSHTAASFVAGAASGLYAAVALIVSRIGEMPGVAPSVSNATVLALALSPVLGVLLLRRAGPLRARARWLGFGVAGVAAWLVAPIVSDIPRMGRVEVIMLDVGQGDALLIRTPDARWIVVDAGPAGRGRDAGADVVLPFLARRGVRRLERVYFTHPDLDHIGGGSVLLSSLPVGVVSDPGLAEGKNSYLTLLETADHQGIPWESARPGSFWSGGGVTLRVLAPLPVPLGAGAFANDTDANAASIVLSLEYGEFRMLLTGDAPDDMEAAMGMAGLLEDVDVLKVGHHGSNTSTSWNFLERIRPELALVSVGRTNRYGHPHPVVLERLQRIGARVERTDLVGHIRVLARADGDWTVETGSIR